MAPHIGSHRALCSCLPKKGIPSAVVWTVRRWCQDYTAGLEESSTGEAPRLQKFCRHLTTECSRHHASRNVSWPQRAPSAVGHETAVVGQLLANYRHALNSATCSIRCLLCVKRLAQLVDIYTNRNQQTRLAGSLRGHDVQQDPSTEVSRCQRRFLPLPASAATHLWLC